MHLSGKKLLFIFHNSGLTGASIVLLRYVEYLKQHHSSVELKFLLPGKGKIQERLEKIGSIDYYAVRNELSFGDRVKRKLGISNAAHDRVQYAAELAMNFKPDLIYCNTIACSDFVPVLKKKMDVPLVWHIHELKTGIELTGIDPYRSLPLADIIVTNSTTTTEFLATAYGIPVRQMRIVFPSLPAHNKVKIKSAGQKIIGSSGTALPSKGALLFIELAAEMVKRNAGANYRFVWVGNFRKHQQEIEEAIRSRNAEAIVQFVGETDTPIDEYCSMDVFVSLSLEESFGLALVEAGSVGVPVAAFADAGEISTIVRQCDGILVPRGQVRDMAVALEKLLGSQEQLEEKGKTARKHCQTYFNENIVPEWMRVLEGVISIKSVV